MQLKAFAIASLAGLASAQNSTSQNLTSVLGSTPELSNLTALLTSVTPDLAATLSTASNITILAPSNDAIGAFLSSNASSALANNTDYISALLQYHVLQGIIPASAITDTATFPQTLANSSSGLVNVTGGQVVEAVTGDGDVLIFSGLLQGSTVTTPNVNFTGGIVHIIDTVLQLPAPISITAIFANLTSVVGALTQAGIAETVDTTPDITVFVPTNEAFEAIGSAVSNLTTQQLASILEYHGMSRITLASPYQSSLFRS